ncbi:hypothetical protein Y032_0440g1511, partial [Ancylostoma ceylanicum]
MPHNDSSRLRRQIGFFKKLIQRNCSSVAQTLSEYEIESKQPSLSKLDVDQLEALRLELHTTRTSLLKAYTRLTSLHDEWSVLQQSDPLELDAFAEYIAKYGDYRTSVTQAVSQLEELDSLLNEIDNEFRGRDLSLSSEASDSAASDDRHEAKPIQPIDRQLPSHPNAPMSHPDPLLPRTTTTAANAPYNSSLLNFVDASILSKLELPTFDGNLLDYPEFSARFATLVGNKPQLDNTTKFSLLKSCLRGRALQSIQGLSMTAENYSIAMDILKTHYDDKVTMRHILYTKLAQLPSCDPEGRQLPILYNRMFSLIRQFSNGNDDSKETALGALLLNKLPVRVRSQIYDRTGNSHNVTPSELLHLLTDIVRKDSTLFEIEYHSKQQMNISHLHQGFHISSTTDTRPTSKRRIQRKTSKGCPFCNSMLHSAIECNVFINVKQRNEQVRIRRLCYNCLSPRHSTQECPSKYTCKFCSKKHHSSLCFRSSHQVRGKLQPQPSSTLIRQKPNSMTDRPLKPQNHSAHVTELLADSAQHHQVEPLSTVRRTDDAATLTCSSNQQMPPITNHSSQASLMCATVSLFNPSKPSKQINATALFDSGSSKSYITEELAASLNLSVHTTEDITISTFGTNDSLHLRCANHTIGIITEKGAKHLEVKSVPTLTGNLQQILVDTQADQEDFTIFTCKPSILIGNDYFWDIVLSDDFHYRLLPKGYRLLHTTVGNIILKESLNLRNTRSYTSLVANDNLANPNYHDELSELVTKFWKLETVGIIDDPAKRDDEECLNFFNNTISYDKQDQRYVVKLPFKIEPSQLPNNFSLAFSRLCSQLRTLKQNEKLMHKYHAVIMDQLQRGIIEKVPTEEISTHYLSHHGVIKKEGDDIKIRCVNDGSARTKGNLSLNDSLYRGPVLLPDLAGILLRIRFYKILISSDIEKAFLMVGLHVDSRDYTRFLWLNDPTRPLTRDNVVTYRFTRVPF